MTLLRSIMLNHGISKLVVVVLACGGGACATTQEYAAFAQAGSTYATAVDRLLVISRETTVDATSNRLLQDDALANLTPADYRALSDTDRMRLETIERLRLHAGLLGRYFRTLSRLTDSNASTETKVALKGTVEGLNTVGKELRSSSLLNADANAAIGAIGELVVSAKIRGDLREEFQSRQATLRQEMVLQEQLLKALSEAITHDLQITAQIREQQSVIAPLTDARPISNSDQWMLLRRTVLLGNPEIAELQNASRAAGEMRNAFEDLVAGHLSTARLTAVLGEFESILGVAEHVMAAADK